MLFRTISPLRRFLIQVSLAILTVSLLTSVGDVMPTRAEAPPPGPRPGNGLPPDRPERGLVYDGLEVATSGRCEGALKVRNMPLCTHGPDPAPGSMDVEASVLAVSSLTATATSRPICEGDGVSGPRTQVLYVRASNRADRYASYLSSFRKWALDADAIYNASAGETGGSRRIRFVHDSDCTITVKNVVLSPTGDDSFGNTTSQLASLGYNRTDRKYMMFVDANVYCGFGSIMYDDQPGSANANNRGPSYARIDAGCWNGQMAAHEHMHTLGGIQHSAPHASGGLHCVDEYDVMCYTDPPYYPRMRYVCTDAAHEKRFDCKHDDYFHTNAPSGSYLATRWNTADSRFLVIHPETTITSAPPAYSGSTTARFAFSSATPQASFQCSLDGQAFAACASPRSYDGLAAGKHTFQVRARDSAGVVDPHPATYSWTIDPTAPRVVGVAPAAGVTGIGRRTTVEAVFSQEMSSATLTTSTFTLTKKGGTVRVSASVAYDPQTRRAALRPTTYLAASTTYTARIKGGTAGARDVRNKPLPVDKVWSFATNASGDVTAPTVAGLVPAPSSAGVAATANVEATFSEAMSTASLTTSTVTLARKDTTTPVAATVSYNATSRKVTLNPSTDLRAGVTYVATVRGGASGARDRAGNPLAVNKVWSFTTAPPDTTAPDTTIASGPSGATRSASASFGFASSEPGSTFQCSLDGAAFAACASPRAYTGLTPGSHTFRVRARDAAGNIDGTPATRAWTVDTTAPSATITSGPSGATRSTSASFGFTSSEGGSTFECSLDGAVFAICASPTAYPALAQGAHTFLVRARDAAGNVDASPASRAWTVDTVAPDTTITSGPSGLGAGATATFGFTSADGGARFECRLEGYNDGFESCTSPKAYTGLSEGPYTFRVRATDAAGNVDSTPASRSFTLDATAPSLSGAEVDGAALRLTFDEALDGASVPQAGAFIVRVGGVARAMSGVAISSDANGGHVALTLASKVYSTDAAVTVGYTPGTPPIRDAAGNDAAGFPSADVVNTTVPGPAPYNGDVDESTLDLYFDMALSADSVPAAGDFTVRVDGAARGVSSVALSAADGTLVVLELASPVTSADTTITVSYTPGTNPIRSAEGREAEPFADFEVWNSTP